MGAKRGPGTEALREQLAQEAARLIVDHGIYDYGQAKRKAALRFGVREVSALPSNSEIESSVSVSSSRRCTSGGSRPCAG